MTPYPDVTCIGETLVDFVSTEKGTTLSEAVGFLKLAGGAPANVAVGLAKLGTRSAFVGKVGADPFGRFLCSELKRYGVDTSGIRFDDTHKTRLAFVSLTQSGDRDFEFWEKSPADEQLFPKDVDIPRVAKSKITTVSSFLLIHEPARTSIFNIIKKLRHEGCLIAFDPNLRLSLWTNRNDARNTILKTIRLSNILRMNDEEAKFLSGLKDVEAAAEKFISMGPALVVVTLGKKGCYFRTARHSGFVKGFRVKNADTTGCGDGFYAALLNGLVQSGKSMAELTLTDLVSLSRTANAVGALTAAKHGGIPALPDISLLKKFLKANRVAYR
ncbi:MAG TPA: carbohydrate kinase [Bacteroidota bacterium]|nr:carbohydrate kinase [Bacteroidota bacterium]